MSKRMMTHVEAMMALAEAVDGIYMPKRMMVYANTDDDVCRSGR